ncbi:MAG TPA: CopG family transcriptional regulator [Acidimicrobiia bacterium]|nr:CopG family transcriptional regulator [Acidimicrobiia bacterium]
MANGGLEPLIWAQLCCMPATRAQIYLTEGQRQRIDVRAGAEGVTMAEIIRRALDSYLDDETPDPEPALAATLGASPDANVPNRDEWDRG